MKLKILRNVFFDGLKNIQNIVEKRHTLPILSSFLLETTDEKEINITATDLEIGFKGSFPAEVLDPGSITLSAKKSFDILRELPIDAKISLNVEKENWVKIETERIKFRVAGLPSDDYPVIEEQPAGCAFEIETESFKDMIAKTIFAASAEDNRQAVSGILMELLENTTLRMVATDGHRLAMVKRKVDIQRSLSEVHCERQETTSSKQLSSIIIPRRALVELRRIIEGNAGQEKEIENHESGEGNRLQIEIHEGGVSFRKGKVQLTTRALEGPFPEYDYVIPKGCEKVVQIDRIMFLKALRRVSLLADEKFKPIILQIGEETMSILSNTPEMGEAQEELSVLLYVGSRAENLNPKTQNQELIQDSEPENSGSSVMDIGFNARYLMDLCSVLDGEFIAMELNNPVEAVLLKSWEEEDYLCVIMPMRFN